MRLPSVLESVSVIGNIQPIMTVPTTEGLLRALTFFIVIWVLISVFVSIISTQPIKLKIVIQEISRSEFKLNGRKEKPCLSFLRVAMEQKLSWVSNIRFMKLIY
ncbi:hypothetical protein AAHB65_00075 [Bacillus toyonensis]